MGEMNNEEIEQRFNEIIDGIEGKRKSVAEMTMASELLDEQQRILEQHRKLADFLLDLKNAERDLRLQVQQLVYDAETATLKIKLARNSSDRAELERLKDPTSKMQERSGAASTRLEQLNEHQRRIMEFHAEIFQIEVAIQNRRRELSL